MNVIAIVGRVKELPEVKETSSGIKICQLLLEVDRNFKNPEGIYEKDIMQVTLWRGVAESTSSIAKIGSLIGVKGRVQANSYEAKDGNTYYPIEIIAEKVEFFDWIK